MTDSQLTAIIGATTIFLGGLGGFVKWMFSQWLDDRKEERAERKAERDATTAATVAVAVAMNTMSLKFDGFERTLGHVARDVEEISGIHDAPPQPPRRAQTPPKGLRVERPWTHRDE